MKILSFFLFLLFLNPVFSKEIIPLKETEVLDLFKLILENQDFLYEIDDESYLILQTII